MQICYMRREVLTDAAEQRRRHHISLVRSGWCCGRWRCGSEGRWWRLRSKLWGNARKMMRWRGTKGKGKNDPWPSEGISDRRGNRGTKKWISDIVIALVFGGSLMKRDVFTWFLYRDDVTVIYYNLKRWRHGGLPSAYGNDAMAVYKILWRSRSFF